MSNVHDPLNHPRTTWTGHCPRCDSECDWSSEVRSGTLHYSMNCPECGPIRWQQGSLTGTEQSVPNQSTFVSRIAQRIGWR